MTAQRNACAPNQQWNKWNETKWIHSVQKIKENLGKRIDAARIFRFIQLVEFLIFGYIFFKSSYDATHGKSYLCHLAAYNSHKIEYWELSTERCYRRQRWHHTIPVTNCNLQSQKLNWFDGSEKSIKLRLEEINQMRHGRSLLDFPFTILFSSESNKTSAKLKINEVRAKCPN